MRTHYIPAAIALTAAYLLAAAPAWARETPRDCAVFGPHSYSCARGLHNAREHEWRAEEYRRHRQWERNHDFHH